MTAAPASAPASVAEASSKGDGEDDESEEEEEEEDDEEETRYANARFNSREKKISCNMQHYHSVLLFVALMYRYIMLNLDFFTSITFLSRKKYRGKRRGRFCLQRRG